jgi:predicted PurR-regulated permease PerM
MRVRGTDESEAEGTEGDRVSASLPRPVPPLENELPVPRPHPPSPSGQAVPRTALSGLFVLAVLGALYAARAVILPLLLAFLLSLLLAPVVRVLRHLRIPRWIASALVALGLVSVVGTLGYYLASPAADWMDRAPRSLARLEAKLRQIKEPVEKVSRATEQVERMTDVGGRKTQEVQVASQSLSGDLVDMTIAVVSATAVMLVLLYFLLRGCEEIPRAPWRRASAMRGFAHGRDPVSDP